MGLLAFLMASRMDLEDSARPAPAVVAFRLSQWPSDKSLGSIDDPEQGGGLVCLQLL